MVASLGESADFFVQARMGSSRLPGKVLFPLVSHPVLYHVCSRIQKSKYLNRLIVLTSTDDNDNKIEEFCLKEGYLCYRGELEDVLDRFYQAGMFYNSKYIVRITADCPCIDPSLIDELVEFYFINSFDYASNCLESTYPDGFDCEVFSFNMLKKAHQETNVSYHREHVTAYMYENKKKFRIGSYCAEINKGHYRVTLDTHEDFFVLTQIFQALYYRDNVFSYNAILDFLEENPQLCNINKHLLRSIEILQKVEKHENDT
jgi:spore coat polysaccharide biosynthesis protein SpsF